MLAAVTGPIDLARAELLDCTLRDGSYAVDFQFDVEFVADIISHLDATSIRKIEIGHGLGIEATRAGITACNLADDQWVDIAQATVTRSTWGMFAQPWFTRGETIERLVGRGMSFVRVGIEASEVRQNLDYLARLVSVCDEVYLNLMKTGSTPAEKLPAMLEGISADLAGIYVVDSCGSMLPSDVKRYVTTLRRITDTVGFHGHDNLGLANANSIVALESGAAIADGTLGGIGRSAGNAELESLAAILALTNDDRYDYARLGQLAELCRLNMDVIAENRETQLIGGAIGVHSGYFPLVEKLSVECGASIAKIMETASDLAPYSVTEHHIRDAASQLRNRATSPDPVSA